MRIGVLLLPLTWAASLPTLSIHSDNSTLSVLSATRRLERRESSKLILAFGGSFAVPDPGYFSAQDFDSEGRHWTGQRVGWSHGPKVKVAVLLNTFRGLEDWLTTRQTRLPRHFKDSDPLHLKDEDGPKPFLWPIGDLQRVQQQFLVNTMDDEEVTFGDVRALTRWTIRFLHDLTPHGIVQTQTDWHYLYGYWQREGNSYAWTTTLIGDFLFY